jgi:hypothetical protein
VDKVPTPSAGAVLDDPALPETWSQTENVVWPFVAHGLVYVSSGYPGGALRPV